ncbi:MULTISPECIES: ROK family transcriptional regulator [Prauserella salsuginis group]|uniref:Putative NBD/HSP70 family sugar kinase n=1 Tax=Prauserella sediminis TaxID=577680 RepID=A0A839XTQ6_9PSEU|nr:MULTISPECIES: ROK family protein [Prauserella salsuginis group]MBB3663386.1 putative NBD/HSP70 family sugar kinase [Prauserella sediminis]
MTNEPGSSPSATSPGHVLAVLREHGPLTRQELQERVGLSRVTLVERLEALRSHGLVRASGHRRSSGGRRAEVLEVDVETPSALTVDLGQSHAALAITDLRGTVLARDHHRLPARHGPDDVVPLLLRSGRELLDRAGRGDTLRALALSLPGQIDHDRGVTVAPPTMPDWNERPLREPFADAFGVPVLLENDANALAFGDYCAMDRPDSTVVGVKVGTGIGAGVIVSRRIHRGESGTAGEMGHMRIEGDDRRCACGRHGCVAASASGMALVRQLRPSGARSIDDVVRRVRDGHGDAVRAAAEAGRLVGTVLATVVTIVNPRYVRVGGAIGVLEPFLDALRGTVETNAHASALRGLDIGPSGLGEDGAFAGLAGLVADELLAPSTVDNRVGAG